MEEHEQKAEELEGEVDELAEQGDRVKGSVEDARSDLDAKLGDTTVPGLLSEEDAAPGGEPLSYPDDEEDDASA
jgi:hypothetical protein